MISVPVGGPHHHPAALAPAPPAGPAAEATVSNIVPRTSTSPRAVTMRKLSPARAGVTSAINRPSCRRTRSCGGPDSRVKRAPGDARSVAGGRSFGARRGAERPARRSAAARQRRFLRGVGDRNSSSNSAAATAPPAPASSSGRHQRSRGRTPAAAAAARSPASTATAASTCGAHPPLLRGLGRDERQRRSQARHLPLHPPVLGAGRDTPPGAPAARRSPPATPAGRCRRDPGRRAALAFTATPPSSAARSARRAWCSRRHNVPSGTPSTSATSTPGISSTSHIT